jgi:hypothetical protein
MNFNPATGTGTTTSQRYKVSSWFVFLKNKKSYINVLTTAPGNKTPQNR